MSKQPQLSIVTPNYNEELNIPLFFNSLSSVMQNLQVSWELILVDDGSTDGTWAAIQELTNAHPECSGLRLSRNFGHQYALLAGLHACSGQAIIMMDGDLQHPPELIPKLFSEWQNGTQIVHTIRQDQANLPPVKRYTSRLFYRLFSYLSGVDLEPGMADFRLIDQAVLGDLLQFKEEGLFWRGLVSWVGYNSSRVPFQCANRAYGQSTYTFKKMLEFAWTGITSFSLVPLRASILIGVATSFLAFMELFYALMIWLFTDDTVRGWTSGIALISFLFGVLFIVLGMLGEYLGRILIEVRGRPRFLVSAQAGRKKPVYDQQHRTHQSNT